MAKEDINAGVKLDAADIDHEDLAAEKAVVALDTGTMAVDSPVPGSWDPRVLVVDDDEISRGAAVGLLEALGVTVDVAAGGHEAIRMSAQRPYGAIFMDCQMPEVDGYTAVRRLRRTEANARTPVIAVTSRPRWVSLASGMDHHLTKPLEIDGLRADCRRLGLLGPANDRPDGPTEILRHDVPLLDPDVFKALATDDRARIAYPAVRFIEEATARLPELWRAANAGDCGTLRALAIALQSRADHIGAKRLGALCADLNHAAVEHDIASAAGIEVQLRDVVDESRCALAAYTEGTWSHPVQAPVIEATTDLGGPSELVRVALADDDPLARGMVQAMLEQADWIELVGVASGVEEIVALAAAQRPAVVVLDWLMPAGGGEAAARRIRDDHQETVIVALTSSDRLEALTEMVSAGASCLVVKGGSAQHLTQTIARTLKLATATSAAEEDTQSARLGMGASTSPPRPPWSGEPLDRAGLQRLQAGFGPTGILGELVELFGSQTPVRLISMRSAIQMGDAGAVSSDAHQLKGGCLTLAANHMAQLCDTLELSAGSGSLDGAGVLVDQIESAFEQAHAALLREVS